MTTGTIEPTVDSLANDLQLFDSNLTAAKEIAATLEDAALIVVENPERREFLFQLTKDGAAILKKIEGRRTEIVKPLNDRVKAVNDNAKRALAAPIEAAIEKAKAAMVTWDRELARKQEAERQRIAEEARQREEDARAEQARIEAERQADIARVETEARQRREQEIEAMEPGPEKAAALRELRGEVAQAVETINHNADQGIAHADILSRTASVQVEGAIAKLEADTGRGVSKRWTFRVTDMAALYAARPDLVKAEPRTFLINGEVAAGVREIPGIEIFEDQSIVLR